MVGALWSGVVTVNTGLHTGVFDLVWQSGWMVKLVLFFLLLASVVSWAVIVTKFRNFSVARRESENFLKAFWHGKDLEEVFQKSSHSYSAAPVANVFKAGFKELKKWTDDLNAGSKSEILRSQGIENVTRSLNRASVIEITALEESVGMLATVGSAAPFVGLFGTVWGIMNSFQGIGALGSANLAVVAPGISEALIATAAGLGAAIPAVVAYNYFVHQIKTLAAEIDSFSQDFLNIIQRSLAK